MISSFWISFNTYIDSNIIKDKFRVISQKTGELKVSMKITGSFFKTIAYRLYLLSELPPLDTITLKISGDLIDIYGEGFDGNGIYEGSPIDDYVKIFYTEPITSTQELELRLNNFLVYQNYPNPFNPSTTIEYQISNYEYINLKIFDILGREIKTLVNEYQVPGKYKIFFDVNSSIYKLSSGVYYYRLQAGNYIETKRMLLLK